MAERPTGLGVYMTTGVGTIGILRDKDYQRVFKGMFADQKLTLSPDDGKATFLERFFDADIAYMNVHANASVLIVGGSERVEIIDMIRAYKARKRAPALTIVTGCKTLKIETKVNFPRAIGINDTPKKRAFIGFDQLVIGIASDRYFRVFLGHWMKAKQDGSYRTLDEARDDARAFIEKIISLPSKDRGKLMRFSRFDIAIARKLIIIGSADLRLTDLPVGEDAIDLEGRTSEDMNRMLRE